MADDLRSGRRRNGEDAGWSPLVRFCRRFVAASSRLSLSRSVRLVAPGPRGWNGSISLVLRPRVGELLLNTVLLVVVSVPLCVALGVGAAWLVERTALPGGTGVGPAWPPRSPFRPLSTAMPGFGGIVPGRTVVGSTDLGAVLLPAGVPPAPRPLPARPSSRGFGRASGDGRYVGSSGSSCRSCGSRSPAARCWSACTCSPSTVPSR